MDVNFVTATAPARVSVRRVVIADRVDVADRRCRIEQVFDARAGVYREQVSQVPDPEAQQRPLRFEDCDLNGSTFTNCDLSHVELTNCNVSGLKINGLLVDELLEEYERARK